MKIYRNGRYGVDIADDGAIVVKKGDWLSKYSAAIHNDFIHVYEYARKGGNGSVQAIINIDQLTTGETIYHLPTAVGHSAPEKTISDIEKKKLIEKTLSKEFNLRGNNLHILDSVINNVGYTDNALTLAEIAGWLSEGSLLSAVASGVAVTSIALFPVGGIIGVVNAYEAGQRAYGMRAVAYTITAWAFNDPIPKSSPRIMQFAQSGFPRVKPNDLALYEKAWKQSSDATLQMLNQEITKTRRSKKSLQILFRALGNGKRADLCLAIMKGFEKQFDSVGVMAWKAKYSVVYPQ